MRKVWAVFRIIGVLMLALVFVKNIQPVTLHLYLGYSLTLPFFLWLVLVIVIGGVLGYSSGRYQARRSAAAKAARNKSDTDAAAAAAVADAPRVSSLADALRAVPAAPKGEDEHRHYGI